MLLTLAMMVLEITAGYYFNSMALLADGWHMSSHALAGPVRQRLCRCAAGQ
jgi:Co/Zn/Cd efflux system component